MSQYSVKGKMLRLMAKYKIELNLFSSGVTRTAPARPFFTEESSLLTKLEDGIDFTFSSLLEIFLFPSVYDLDSRNCSKGHPKKVGLLCPLFGHHFPWCWERPAGPSIPGGAVLWLGPPVCFSKKQFPQSPASSDQKLCSSKAKCCRGLRAWETDGPCADGGRGVEGVLLSCGDLWKYSTRRRSPSQWKVLVLGAVLARFLCLSGFRLSSTVAGAQETLAAARTCPLLVSPPAILSPHEYPEGADGEGVGETSGTEQKTAWIKQSALAHQEQAGEQIFPLTASWLCPPRASGTLLLQSLCPAPCFSTGWAVGSITHGRAPHGTSAAPPAFLFSSAPVFQRPFPFLFNPFHCDALVGEAFLWLLWDVCLQWDGFQKIFKKKIKPTNVPCFIHYIISPVCFQCFTRFHRDLCCGSEAGDSPALLMNW